MTMKAKLNMPSKRTHADREVIDLVYQALNAAICFPRRDPDRVHLYTAACMVKILKLCGHPVYRGVMKQLRKEEHGNKIDFLKNVERDMVA